MFRKIGIFLFAFLLVGCEQITSAGTTGRSLGRSNYTWRSFQGQMMEDDQNENNFKVAMLLPLTGKASTFGQGLQNAAMMALEDSKNSNLEVRFYDTKSSPDGAIAALDEALHNRARLVLGPLLSEEVSAVSYKAQSNDVPVISFSTSPQVLKRGIYTLGLLTDEQIRRIVSYAAQSGRKKIAVVVPDSSAGLNIAKASVYAASQNGMEVNKIGFYAPSTLEFSELIQEMSKSLDFDTVLVAETGSRLKAIAGTFGYYDVAYPDVLFIGTSVWDNTNLTKETTLYHAVYPTISHVHIDYFNKKYKDLFGQTPNGLYAYAYDGVALASILSTKDISNLEEYILNPDGYIGINGSFRLFEDGTNEHNLDIVEVTPDGLKTVDNAPKTFRPHFSNDSLFVQTYPIIYGKDQQSVYQKLFERQTPSYSSYFDVW